MILDSSFYEKLCQIKMWNNKLKSEIFYQLVKSSARFFINIELARYISFIYRNKNNYKPDDNILAKVK